MGHAVGSRHSRSEQIHRFFQAVDAASDRVTVRQYGRSHDGRALIYGVVTSPRNHARIDAILAANRRLSHDPKSVTDAELESMPTVLWMGYGVHGNEASTPEAALLFLYALAATTDPTHLGWLDRVVVIIDPLYNPDGHDRHVNWLNGNRGRAATADPNHREHNEPWPNGRTNHYLFDLNRDWLPAQQPETQARLEIYHQWMPQLVGDYHEMGADRIYYFHPGIPTRNHPNTPTVLNELTQATSVFLGRSLDQFRVPYYTRESFDDFYYGKGSSYPDINGGVGVLFEQGSSRALVRETVNGLFRFPDTIRNQFVTSMAMLEAADALRPRLLRAQRDIYASVDDWASRQPVKGYVVDLATAPERAQEMLVALGRHGVRAWRPTRDVTVGDQRFPAATSVILPLQQRQGRLLRSALDPATTFPDTGFYDVSAWHMGYAFNVRFAEFKSEVERGAEWTPARVAQPIRRPVDRTALAYALPWGSRGAIAAATSLRLKGFRVGRMLKPMDVDGRRLPAGQIIVFLEEGRTDMTEIETLKEAGEDVIPIYQGLTNIGTDGGDLGSPSMAMMPAPRVAILSGSGTNANAVGEAWHTLTHRWGLPATLLDQDRAATADLGRYTAIVVTDGASATVAPRLRAYVEAGGVLVGTGSGATWAVTQGLLTLRARPDVNTDALAALPYGEIDDARRSLSIPGTILQTQLDVTHPLAMGVGSNLPVLRRGSTFFDPPSTPGVVVARYTQAPLLAGYLHPSQAPRIPGAVAVAATRLGSGSVIAIMDNPNFRGFWVGGEPLFANAVFFGRSF